jgi:hypothetical protein
MSSDGLDGFVKDTRPSLPAALGYGAGVVVLVMYAAGAMEPAGAQLPDVDDGGRHGR